MFRYVPLIKPLRLLCYILFWAIIIFFIIGYWSVTIILGNLLMLHAARCGKIKGNQTCEKCKKILRKVKRFKLKFTFYVQFMTDFAVFITMFLLHENGSVAYICILTFFYVICVNCNPFAMCKSLSLSTSQYFTFR
jgi:hypothetical protein